MSQNPPCQELVAKDLHGTEWHFRHIFRGELTLLAIWLENSFHSFKDSLISVALNLSIFLVSCPPFYVSFRTTEEASPYYWLECLC